MILMRALYFYNVARDFQFPIFGNVNHVLSFINIVRVEYRIQIFAGDVSYRVVKERGRLFEQFINLALDSTFATAVLGHIANRICSQKNQNIE